MITGTHFQYYYVCHRKLWLFSHDIHLEQNSEIVYDGKLLHEQSYLQRSSRYQEVSIEGIKVDYYDRKKGVIHELKRSKKMEEAHVWQLKYYLYVFQSVGIDAKYGLLEYPKLRETKEIMLSDNDREEIEQKKEDIVRICEQDRCPDTIGLPYCKKCAYYDFCYCDA
ncbi:CRISPR-associated protein Cas4 [Halosquirtibacter xylanolyticus]|uniref:CRISPR-associated protein Cas4 n=1 Tax=Halosquirtibacter xylanolyticus TaxID=3374599 RepID=UPI00374A1F91|nr:CRISPR-associated protein Cas4 [Prolixibacteraceae bacterium]